ncbi:MULTISPECIES: prepilin-type N-terminal cleavage/methylation domain-containing protein [Acinetobacter]|uniref:Prepilin-type N-terminal cleavage/methylation domain-containing protein n=1 Tax=Acinetobacter chengduensis TaxID=2420890 RepID=A0ABX9TVP0_9GAMM|nr:MULTISPECIES: prepilin-type N-terminal cleavage/methylation domain-containing protein [Acinetobacter]MBI1452734.1 prepilin-type N-terminal cleavage/methylation domain-containing protein [Acinetobacter sp. FL51]RKG41858.1 prepilin-type N-terminal cleavage/methylation domain-containing protein [Acinetobacter sp. WCHAc060007]RLL20619.1 prepilin-type N-terminal cleavage/methylation domain-containing protein [Acinetobacter chengduensis]
MNLPRRSSIKGFTLVEVMVVIVVMGILASMILMNIGGTDQRKAMQAREVFLMDMQKMLRVANDQSRILALNPQTATDVANFQYNIVEYLPAQQMSGSYNQNNQWKDYSEFEPRVLPDHVSLNIQALDHAYRNANNSELLKQSAPKLIWLGNGEAKPVRVQFYLNDQPIGSEIEIDHLGKIVDES